MGNATNNEIERFIERIEASLDKYIDIGTEDELFVSGYLHGHFSLAASQALQFENPDVALVKTTLSNSLQTAFANNELDNDYQQKVYSMWNELSVIASKG